MVLITTARKTWVTVLVITLICLGFSVAASAQNIEQGKPYGIEADHDGLNTETYEARVNGSTVLSASVSSLVGSVIRFPNMPAPQNRTALAITICALNEAGESCSDGLIVSVVRPKPNKPGKPRITSGLLSTMLLEPLGKVVGKATRRGEESRGFTARLVE